MINGDKLRDIFKIKGYSREERLNIGISYSKISKLLTNNNINVIIATVGLFHELHKYNRKTLSNYVEIFLKCKIKKLIKKQKEIFFIKKNKKCMGY